MNKSANDFQFGIQAFILILGVLFSISGKKDV